MQNFTHKNLALIAFFILSVGVISHFAIRSALDSLLLREAEVATMDWAHHVKRNFPNLAFADSANFEKFDVETAKFKLVLRNSVTVGNIYRADLINIHCLCIFTSIGNGDRLAVHKQHLVEDAHVAPTESVSSYDRSLDKVMMSNLDSRHMMMKIAEGGADKARYSNALQEVLLRRDAKFDHVITSKQSVPVDHDVLQRTPEKADAVIRIFQDFGEGNPQYIAEFYHPVLVEGQINQYLRFLINIDEPASHYKMFLYTSALVLALMLIAAFIIPMKKILAATYQERLASERVHYLANRDSLTGLANRHAIQTLIPKMMAKAQSKGKLMGMMLIDVHNFSSINDFHGHQIGDQVLQKTAAIIKKRAPAGSIIARIGGDQFALFSESSAETFEDLGAQLDLDVQRAFRNGKASVELDLKLSKGLALCPDHGDSLVQLMQHANLALNGSKAVNHHAVLAFKPEMAEHFQSRVETLSAFKAALENKEIVPFYQPIVNFNNGTVIAFEALARWNHPTRGILTPVAFQDALDDVSLSALLGAEMLRLVSADMKRWGETGVDFRMIGLNIAEGDLRRPGFVLDVMHCISEAGIQPNQLVLEVTENSLYGEKFDEGMMKLQQLRDVGCRVSLDDFGTGYSSITQLKKLPCTSVKLDKSFVYNVTDNAGDQAIVRALLDLGEVIGYKLVIEGVETQEQADLLRSFGCKYAQGYFYAKPVSSETVPSLLERMNNSGADMSNKNQKLTLVR